MSLNKVVSNHTQFEGNISKLIDYGLSIFYTDIIAKAINKKQKVILLESLLLRACALWEK